MVEIRIRSGCPGDFGAITELIGRIENFSPEEVEVARSVVAEGLCLEEDKGYKFICAEDGDGSIVAYACYGQVPLTDGTYDLYWIAVDPMARRLGLGRRLLAAVEDDLRSTGARQLFIETSGKDNYNEARRFYQSLGYHLAIRLRDFYRPGDDKYLYYKQFM